jgi:hypothetical protein
MRTSPENAGGPHSQRVARTPRITQEWIAEVYPTKAKRQAYMERNYVPDVDLKFSSFLEFYRARRELMLDALRRMLDVHPSSAPSAPGVSVAHTAAN